VCKLLERPIPADSNDALRWLVYEKMAEIDGDGGYITNFGAIAAARDLRQFDTLQRKRIRVIRYRGFNKVETIDELVGQKGYAIGFEGLIGYLKRILPHSEVIREALRAEVTVYPEISLRELIANALIHQDFTIAGAGPMIEVFDDRIEFTNPGGLLPGKTVDRLIGATPESRNEVLAAAFRRYRICEERGSGVDKVVQAAEVYQLPAPDFRVGDRRTSAVLFAYQDFEKMDRNDRMRACYQHCCLRYVMNEKMTNQSLRERFKLSEDKVASVSQIIAATVESGKIKPTDPTQTSTRYRSYVPFWA